MLGGDLGSLLYGDVSVMDRNHTPICASDIFYIYILAEKWQHYTFIGSVYSFAVITVQNLSNFIRFHRNFAVFNPFGAPNEITNCSYSFTTIVLWRYDF